MPREELSTPITFPPRAGKARRKRRVTYCTRTVPRQPMKGRCLRRIKKSPERVFPDQQKWFQRVPKDYRKRHPRHPKLTNDELMRICDRVPPGE